jgi:hypothetical protein
MHLGSVGHFVRWPLVRRRSAHVHLDIHDHPDLTSCICIENVLFDTMQLALMQVEGPTPPLANTIAIGTANFVTGS